MSDAEFRRGAERFESNLLNQYLDQPDRCVVCRREGTDLCAGCEQVAE